MVNIRTKGHDFERKIAGDFNLVIWRVFRDSSLNPPTKDIVQRNQNQSAAGGGDLVGAFGLSVEIKAQEALSVNSWWAQCCKSADDAKQVPVLIYKQNQVPPKVCMECEIPYPHIPSRTMRTRVTFEYEVFLKWFEDYVRTCVAKGWIPVYS